MRGASDNKRLMRDIEKDRRASVVRRLAELRGLLKAARTARNDAVSNIRGQCRVARVKLRTQCGARINGAKAKGKESIGVRLRELRDERNNEKQLAAERRNRRGAAKAAVGSAPPERESGSDNKLQSNEL